MLSNTTFPTKQDDFLPYANDPHSYWTGYYTSRPTSKYFLRQAEMLSQVHNQLEVLHNLPLIGDNVNSLDESVAVGQHHDAITGTERQHVADDYHKRLFQSIEVNQGSQFTFRLQFEYFLSLATIKVCICLPIK